MHKVTVEHECGCFRKSTLDNHLAIANKDDALLKALEMTNTMNNDFCGKHEFQVIEDNNNFLISVAMPQKSSGCCGGGCGHH